MYSTKWEVFRFSSISKSCQEKWYFRCSNARSATGGVSESELPLPR